MSCHCVPKVDNAPLTRPHLTHSMKTLVYVEIPARMDVHGVSLARSTTSAISAGPITESSNQPFATVTASLGGLEET